MRYLDSLDNHDQMLTTLQTDRDYYISNKTSLYRQFSDRSQSGVSQKINDFAASAGEHFIEKEDVDIFNDKQLGGGKFGAVFEGTYRGAVAAFKRLNDLEHFTQEGDLFFKCCLHPHM